MPKALLTVFLALIFTGQVFAGGGSIDLGDAGVTTKALARLVPTLSKLSPEQLSLLLGLDSPDKIQGLLAKLKSIKGRAVLNKQESRRNWDWIAAKTQKYFRSISCTKSTEAEACAKFSFLDLQNNVAVIFKDYPLVLSHEMFWSENPLNIFYREPGRSCDRSVIQVSNENSRSVAVTFSMQVDAINYPRQSLIKVDQRGFSCAPNLLTRFVLVTHEYLGLLGINDGDYWQSTKISLRVMASIFQTEGLFVLANQRDSQSE